MGLLADYMQDVSATKPNERGDVQAPYLSPGFSDFGDGHDAITNNGGRNGYMGCGISGVDRETIVEIKEGLHE